MNDKIVEFVSDIDSASFDEFLSRSNIDSKLVIDNMFDYDYSWLTEVEEYLPFIANIVNQDYSMTDDNVIKSYENRFIRTLVLKLKDFLENEQDLFEEITINPSERKYKSHVNSLLNDENIEIDIKINCVKNNNSNDSKNGLTIKDRIKRLIKLNNTFLESDLLKRLSDAPLVHTVNVTEIFNEEIVH